MKTTLKLMVLILMISACKKQQTQPMVSDPNSGKYEVEVNSNYIFPYLRIAKNGTVFKSFNYTWQKDSVKLFYKFSATEIADYEIYFHASKNSIDTTKNMSDDNILWVSMKITLNGVVKKDTTVYAVPNTGASKMVQYGYNFKIK